MRLFAYYAVHTFKNQLKKLFKTWLLVFIIVCALFGGIIGYTVGSIFDDEETPYEAPPSQTEYSDDQSQAEDYDISIFEATGHDVNEFTELISGVVILAVLIFMISRSDKNGSRIFLPADVNLLFASPMKPQSVLMFRLTTQLGLSVFAGVYLIFQIPTLRNIGLGTFASFMVIPTFCLTIAMATLIQTLFYTLSTTYPAFKSVFKKAILVLPLLIALGDIFTIKQSGAGLLNSQFLFFNSKISRYIPIWGWLKGFFMYMVENNISGALISLAAILISIAVLIYMIRHIKADFYEEAMNKSQEIAEMIQAAQSDKSGGILIKRKKDRSKKIRRDTFQYGNGANVFFYKSLYNRFRFSHFGFLTKTTEVYLVAAISIGAICRFAVGTSDIMPIALVLAGLSFFRSLGNSLEEDAKMDFFILIPESDRAKLFWSLMGGSANCFLDILLPMVAGAILIKADLLTTLLWIPLIVSVDFYATTVEAFINFSVPVSAGKTLKQMVKIMFIYFGLVPDAIVMIVGISFNFTLAALLIAPLLNIGLGLLFFGLLPMFLSRQ